MLFTTRGEGQGLRRDVDQIEKDLELQRAELDDAVRDATEEVARVKQLTDEATKLLARNSADVGATVEEARAAVQRLEGRVEEATQALDALRKELGEYRAATDVKLEGLLGQSTKAQAPPLPEGKQELFAEGGRRLEAGQHDEARRLLRHYLSRFGGDDQADNAQLMLGESYFREEKYAAAIGEFQKVIDAFPKGDAVDDAFLKNGQAFFRLKYCTDARVFLQELIRRFPRSPLVQDARKLLGELDRAKKDRAKCTS